MAIGYRPDIVYEYEECLACGAYDEPDARGCCQYCGARLTPGDLDY